MQCNAMQYNTIQYSTTPFQRNQCNAMQYMYNTVNAMHRNPTQHNTKQDNACNTKQYFMH